MGSGAFNLLVISAASIVAVKDTKKIYDLPTYYVTVISSLWAYVWLFLVLAVISPEEVELWEGCLTFAFFFVLLAVAFISDKCNASMVNKDEVRAKEKR